MANAAAAAESTFYWPLRLIDPSRRAAMMTVYAWCRHVDRLADLAADGATRLFAWRAWTAGDSSRLDADERAMADAFSDVMARHGIDRRWPDELLDGLTMDLAGDMRAPTMETLSVYCRRVATIPGRMCLVILGWRGPDAEAFADAAGIAVQLTNILRDVDEDADLGRLYIPREALNSAGIAASDPRIAIADARFGQAWLALALLAEARFVHADTLLPAHRRKQVWPALAMLAIYRDLLRRLRRRGWKTPAPIVRVPRWRRFQIAAFCMVRGR